MITQAEVPVFFLEFDDERSGGFTPLRFVPPGKQVVELLTVADHGRFLQLRMANPRAYRDNFGVAPAATATHDPSRFARLRRMLAGLGESDTARAHARELLDAARGER